MKITVDAAEVKRLLAKMPKEARRAAEQALDRTALDIKVAVVEEMRKVFDRPTRYTLNSLYVTKTRNHNMVASVWFKEPPRMKDHYLVPQVEGTERKLKGFERAIFGKKYIPGRGVKLNQYGNVTGGQIRQILSVLGMAERTLGYSANITSRSAKRNKKPRDYVVLPSGSPRGKLPPGIYQRVIRGKKLGRKAQSSVTRPGTYEQGKRKSAIRATGLLPILIFGRQKAKVRPRLKFYDIAERTYNKRFHNHFSFFFNSLVSR